MLRGILIGLDGSPYCASALELGVLWAKQFDATLVGLGIVDEPTICQSGMAPIGGSHFKQHRDEAIMGRARKQVEQFLEQFALRCGEGKVTSKTLNVVGTPSEQICLEAQRVDVILLGQQTQFHFATQTEPCETLQKVLKNAPRPVVVVPETLNHGSSVVIAYDGSLQAARTLQAFQASGLAATREVHVVSISSNHEEAVAHATRGIEFLRLHDIEGQLHAVKTTPSSEVIMEQARHLDAQLVVMGAYGQSTLREFFLGSVTRSALHKSTIPLFLYH